jgi:putative membrane protein
MYLIIRWLLNTISLILVANILPGIQISSYWTALVAVAVLSIINSIIRPILIILTLPINILTLGLFTLIINGLMFWLASHLVIGFTLASFATAFWAALLFSIISWIINSVFYHPKNEA